ncbi:MAG: polysialyltransferase family glycosyltransferase [Candidatus Staskawiczbacteria bacterium]|nr:polysialyltransferase family glycosyltransferase [Candidatus Staskawiczbacteria bacterium]
MRKIEKKYIIFVAEQAGGIDVFFPVIERIQNDGKFEFALFLGNKDIYEYAEKKGIKNLHLSVGFSVQEVEDIIEKENPDLFITDTNNTELEDSLDKKIIKASKDAGRPAISIVDSWINYGERFGKKLEFIPDSILVIDGEMKGDLEKIGIPSDIIKIVGNPRFDKFSDIKKTREEKNLIVFYSQPFSSKGMSEVDVFKDIVDVLDKRYPEKKIIIKFHPSREKDKDKYDSIIKDSKLSIEKLKGDVNADALTQKAELIMGMHSMALFDAALMGKKVLSYQPGKDATSDTLRSNVYGWSVPVYKKEDILGVIESVLKGKVLSEKRQRTKYTKNKSADKVASLIEHILENK